MKQKVYEVYTLNDTIIVQAESLEDAMYKVAIDDDSEDVIGVIELEMFHKGATQKPDLI